jgi:SWIM zinc finger
MSLTMEAVLALAPDDASAKAARGLLAPAKWPLLGHNDAAVWGECQGSGAKPYQTQVDLAGPAFRCSCPSRKFPCKHGLALLMMRAQGAASFSTAPSPAWVAEWLTSRGTKAQQKEERLQEKAAAPVDPLAAAKRDAQRWQRIEQAGVELQRWLADQVARGLGALNADVLTTWQTMAARMVDAQAPGLGHRVRELAAGVNQGADWPELTLHRMGLLQLICEALRRRSALSAPLQADLRAAVGWPQDKAEMLAQAELLGDRWAVLGSATEERDNKLVERRVWLQGQRSGRRALLLDHAFAGKGFEQAWLTGQSVEAQLAFFPSASPLRAMVVDVLDSTALTYSVLDRHTTLHDEWDSVAHRVANCPWTGVQPLLLHQAQLLRQGDDMWAVVQGRALTLVLSDADTWQLLATTGGRPCQLMGEWNGRELKPLTAWDTLAQAPVWCRAVA